MKEGTLCIENMIFCMNSDCENYYEDNCYIGHLNNDNRKLYNLTNNYKESCEGCKRFRKGVNELYLEELRN